MNDTNQHVAAAMMFEKAFSLADSAQRIASNGRAANLLPGDGAKIFYDDLAILKEKYRKASDKAMARAKASADLTDEPFENLANAIVERAVLDYEIALSFHDKGGIKSLEDFAASQYCESLTRLDMTEKLQIVRGKAELFFKYVSKHGKEICAESAAIRKAGQAPCSYGKHKCPLCGGVMYEYVRPRSKRKEIHCSGCSLVGFVP